ncbi:MAG: F0F1 ATP synthase subunit B [Chloroflexi bacterium]|nr:F0F1 ATP synthase subunit B [Chloroflexota bacterium]
MDQLGINVPGLVAQLVNFLLLLFLLTKFVFPRIVQALDARSEKIRLSLDRADEVKAEAERMERQFQERLAEARREGQQIVANANQIAQRIQEDAHARATQDAETFLNRAREQVQRETESARAQLRQEVAGLAILAASRVIQQALSEKDHVDLIHRVLDEAEAGSR